MILTTEVKTKINTYKDEFLRMHPNNEMTKDPAPEGEVTEGFVPKIKYTDSQWLDEVVKRYLINEIKRGKAVLHREALQQTEVTLE